MRSYFIMIFINESV